MGWVTHKLAHPSPDLAVNSFKGSLNSSGITSLKGIGNMALVTTTRAKLVPAINRINSSTSPVGWLESLITLASEEVEEYCFRKFELDNYVEVLNGKGTYSLFLTVTPIVSISALTVTFSDGTTSSYTSADLTFDPNTGEVWFKPGVVLPDSWNDEFSQNSYFPEGIQNVSVSYRGGFDTIPERVQEATIAIILLMAGQGCTSSDLALGSETPGDYRFDYRQNAMKYGLFTPVVVNLLSPFKHYSSGTLSVDLTS